MTDEHFSEPTVRDMWAGVVTSFAWHARQIALTVGLLRWTLHSSRSTAVQSYDDELVRFLDNAAAGRG